MSKKSNFKIDIATPLGVEEEKLTKIAISILKLLFLLISQRF